MQVGLLLIVNDDNQQSSLLWRSEVLANVACLTSRSLAKTLRIAMIQSGAPESRLIMNQVPTLGAKLTKVLPNSAQPV